MVKLRIKRRSADLGFRTAVAPRKEAENWMKNLVDEWHH